MGKPSKGITITVPSNLSITRHLPQNPTNTNLVSEFIRLLSFLPFSRTSQLSVAKTLISEIIMFALIQRRGHQVNNVAICASVIWTNYSHFNKLLLKMLLDGDMLTPAIGSTLYLGSVRITPRVAKIWGHVV